MKRTRQLLVRSTLFTALFLIPIVASAASKAEEAVRKADQDWARVFAAGQLDASVDACTATARVLAPNAPLATGHDEIRKLFAGFFALPDLRITWHPDEIHVAESGELAFSSGHYEMSFKGPDGKQIADNGKYLTVWQKQKNGAWKVVADCFNTNMPMPAP
ncbi:MAG: YybH family protein [Thermoanaerobaculia bacterium]